MVVKLNSKKKVVLEIRKLLIGVVCIIVIDYRGLKSIQMMEIRRISRGINVKFIVVRNTLARLALIGTGYESLIKVLYGPVLLVFSYDEPNSIGKLLNDFSNNSVKLNVKAFIFEFSEVNVAGLDKFVLLPTYKESICKLIFIFKFPLKKLICTILEPYVKFVRLLNIILLMKKNVSI
ncbi:MAG: 50S ribosomal protein L10 [Candidatus Azosocius agrarius]|nr:MAG: 50S ribosomal protein L10 [Gammaproteobacteria bacterium]